MLTLLLGDPPHEAPLVTTARAVDDDLSDAIDFALGNLSVNSVPKAARWLMRWLNFAGGDQDNVDQLFGSNPREVRRCFRAFLISLGCKVVPSPNLRDGSMTVSRATGSIQDISVLVAVARRFHEALRSLGLYADSNPFAIDGWEAAASERVLRTIANRSGEKEHRQETGNQFRTAREDWRPPQIDDPIALIERLVSAAEADQWPITPLSLLYAMTDNGGRSGDLRPCNAYDWSHGDFGRTLHTPSKNSRGRRVKWTILTDRTVAAFIAGVEERHREDPSQPSMDQLRQWKAADDVEKLRAYCLFPSRWNRPISYSGFHAVYFRPTMIKHGIVFGGRTAWPHLTRHGYISRRVEDIFRRTSPGPQRKALLEQLLEELGLKSNQIPRYAQKFLRDEQLAARIADQDRLNAAKHDRDAVPVGWRASSLEPDIAADFGSLAEDEEPVAAGAVW